MSTDGGLALDFKPTRRGGTTGALTASLGGDTFTEKIDIAKSKARQDVVNAIAERWPALQQPETQAEVNKELERLAAKCVAEKDEPAAADSKDGDKSSEELANAMPKDIRDEADALLTDPLLIRRIIDDVAALGVAGERELVATAYLIGTSRLLERTLAGIVQGPSSSGKSYLIEKTSTLFPQETVIHATQMTPQALFHMRPGSLQHRFIVAGERSRVEDDDRAEATRALREMLSSGKLTKLMPVKIDGEIVTMPIEQEGPIAFIESTTSSKIFDEDANRCILLHTDEQPKQSRRILSCLAAGYSGESVTAVRERIILRHHALQRLLQRQPIVIPYAARLGELFTCERVEVRRAFPQVMSMIQASALLHQRQRDTDCEGRIVAVVDDYQLARYLLAKPMAKLLGGGLSEPARRFFERLSTWAHCTFTSSEAKKQENGCKSSVYGWLGELHDAGLLEMIEAPRGRSPATWRLTGENPDDKATASLPAVEEVFPELRRTHGHNAQLATAP